MLQDQELGVAVDTNEKDIAICIRGMQATAKRSCSMVLQET